MSGNNRVKKAKPTRNTRMTNGTGRKWVKFEFRAEPSIEVFVAGTFNNWNPAQARIKEKNGDGIYRTSILLAQGRYEYKFVVNGVWCADPNNRDSAMNEHGTLNSVLTVG
ncbi:MAG: glycoside hydrolase [Verrucomicrobia bacterium]|nr:glycoside hydrolase [Verrucomicrobiota bacterium]